MGATKVCGICAYTVLVFLNIGLIAGKPLFGSRMWCDYFCDDDDTDTDDSSSSTGFEDFLDALFDPCYGCSSGSTSARPATTRPPMNIMIPPSNGMNLTMTQDGSFWNMNFIPWMSSGTTTKAATMGPAASNAVSTVATTVATTGATNATAANATTPAG